ncbi:hypothetical protein Q0812_08165 [Brevundimonas sp. 2R-24]|uniref:Uncharacterized protein n=1 Tax=Peiella sedimenti TaxID=3061083 RepID=A0ABT8SQ08_9CAUL|nr:hypothetical protein [Caulobacteraceae bacterium XZ-24]
MSPTWPKPVTSLSDDAALQARLSFVLEHPDMSPWLKTAVRSMLARASGDVLNDLEILNDIARLRHALSVQAAGQGAPETPREPAAETRPLSLIH